MEFYFQTLIQGSPNIYSCCHTHKGVAAPWAGGGGPLIRVLAPRGVTCKCHRVETAFSFKNNNGRSQKTVMISASGTCRWNC